MKEEEPNLAEKFNRVISKNTFFFKNLRYESKIKIRIQELKDALLELKKKIEVHGFSKEILIEFIKEDYGLDVILVLTGLSQEMLYRLITFIRASDDEDLNSLVNKKAWPTGSLDTEWKMIKIKQLVRENAEIAEGLINFFLKGKDLPIIQNALPAFEYEKIDPVKIKFDTDGLIDTIIRYKIKGSYSATKERNAEIVIEQILENLSILYERGKLPNVRRDMDFIIPSKENPEIIIESSYVTTTSSGMGDKAKTEMSVREEIKAHYPNTKFIGFLDGIGWYVRRGDMERMVSAYDEIFTFHPDELKRFKKYLQSNLSQLAF